MQLLGSDRSFEALEGVAMELEDSLYPLLREVRHTACEEHLKTVVHQAVGVTGFNLSPPILQLEWAPFLSFSSLDFYSYSPA